MSEGNQEQLTAFVIGLLLGAAIGTAAALLTAPQSGRRTRRRLGRTAFQITRNTGDRWEDLADEVKSRVDDAFTGARKRMGR